MTSTALILGPSGKVGGHAGAAFAHAGWNVRRYDRRSGDMVGAARGADVIVNGLNPPSYHDWAHIVPAITAQVLEAAQASGATVLLPGNVYNLDDRGGRWSERTPHAPTTRKGRIREEMEQTYRRAGVRTIVLRAGNFIDPHHGDDVMGVVLLRTLAKGKVTSPGDPDALQAYCYVPDWARAAVALAELRAELEPFEDVPFPGHAFTVDELRGMLGELTGRSIGLARFPWWAMTLAAPFWELARELREMRYLWSLPHELDGDKLARLLPAFAPTPLLEVLRACVTACASAPRAAATVASAP